MLSLLILLYLIYDTYVVRENFADDGFKTQFDTLFGVTQLEDVKDNFDESLSEYCDKIKALNALCTKCDTKAEELEISIENGPEGYIIDKSGYEARGGEDLSLDPNNNFNIPNQALICDTPNYGRFRAHQNYRVH